MKGWNTKLRGFTFFRCKFLLSHSSTSTSYSSLQEPRERKREKGGEVCNEKKNICVISLFEFLTQKDKHVVCVKKTITSSESSQQKHTVVNDSWPQNKYSVIIYSSSCHSKSVWPTFSHGTQMKTCGRISKPLFSIWKHTVIRHCQTQKKMTVINSVGGNALQVTRVT